MAEVGKLLEKKRRNTKEKREESQKAKTQYKKSLGKKKTPKKPEKLPRTRQGY